jgi:hypothetical protein
MKVVDRIAAVRYVLRHHRNDALVEALLDHLDELRLEYRRDRFQFTSKDIAFLRSVGSSIDALMLLAQLQAPLDALRRRSEHLRALQCVRKSLGEISDDTFDPIRQHVGMVISEMHTLFPNDA